MVDEAPPTIAVHREETDLGALLRASLAPLAKDAERQRIELRVTTLGDIPNVHVDREKIAWCTASLVGNALRYVRRGELGGELGGSVIVQLVSESPGSVMISVQDDGPGIPDEQLPYLFERRLGSLHAEGLALVLVRDIVKAHGGDIQVETRRGSEEHGTTITLRL